MNWTWNEAAEYCENEFGSYVDWDEEFFICPECGEPLYKEDYESHRWAVCPVCESAFTEVE